MGIQRDGGDTHPLERVRRPRRRYIGQTKEVVCDDMTNPMIHLMVFIAAVIIPGGLLVYFGWRASKALKAKKPTRASDDPSELELIPGNLPKPDEARKAFEHMFPKESLRARSRLRRLNRLKALKAFRHRNTEK